MALNISRSPPQLAAIFSCEMCSETYASPAELDHHRQIHDIDHDPDRIAIIYNRSRSNSMTVDQARREKGVATPAATTRCFFFCSTCNARVESLDSLKRHNEQFHPTGIETTFEDENLPGTCWRCHHHGYECDCTSSHQSSITRDTSEGYTPQSVRETPDPELSWSSGSASGSSTSQEQEAQMQGTPFLLLNCSPVQPSNSHPRLVTTVFDPKYVAHMPPILESAAVQTNDVSWIDFLVPVEQREPYDESTRFSDPAFSPLSDHFWQRSTDMHLSGYDSPADVVAVSLESLSLLFDADGIRREYQGLEEQMIYLPGMNLLNQLCANYFFHWQKSQPVFHSATWSFIECPMVLVSAMACVGSIFSKDSQVIRQASYINERCTSEINRLVSRFIAWLNMLS